jgi:hypothetical protein
LTLLMRSRQIGYVVTATLPVTLELADHAVKELPRADHLKGNFSSGMVAEEDQEGP